MCIMRVYRGTSKTRVRAERIYLRHWIVRQRGDCKARTAPRGLQRAQAALFDARCSDDGCALSR